MYNILDGKQRIESLILFMGSQTGGNLSIRDWAKYFHLPEDRKDANFEIDLPDGKRKFSRLSQDAVAELSEYLVPTIFITLTPDTPLDEIIDLFVDINQEGEPVSRFDVVKAIGLENPLLQSVFDLLAVKEERQRDHAYKMKNNEFTDVLKRLSLIDGVRDYNAKVDRMWERLLEITSFERTRKHRQPSEILKSFIKSRQERNSDPEPTISSGERKELRRVFRFLRSAYKGGLGNTPLATDQTHFYTMTTSIIIEGLLDKMTPEELLPKLAGIANLLEHPPTKKGAIKTAVNEYLEISQKQTTHLGRREDRQRMFLGLLDFM